GGGAAGPNGSGCWGLEVRVQAIERGIGGRELGLRQCRVGRLGGGGGGAGGEAGTSDSCSAGSAGSTGRGKPRAGVSSPFLTAAPSGGQTVPPASPESGAQRKRRSRGAGAGSPRRNPGGRKDRK